MTLPDWREVPIAKAHDRKGFDCGQPDLNDFLTRHARQEHDGGASKTYVALDAADARTVLGFYTLSPAQIDFENVPAEARHCILASTQVGGTMLFIDARDELAAGWYKFYGAIGVSKAPLSLVLPYSVIIKAMERSGSPIL